MKLTLKVLAAVLGVALSSSAFAVGIDRSDKPLASESLSAPPQTGRQEVFEIKPLISESGDIVGIRADVEDATMAESVVIDTTTGEISGFGLTFRAELNEAGEPIALVVTNGTDVVTLPAEVDESRLNGAQKMQLSRISKQFHTANGKERMDRFAAIIQNAQTARARGAVSSEGWFDCAWNATNIVLDWVGVVGACGAPVVNGFACGFAITWAVADTIKNAHDMATDCK